MLKNNRQYDEKNLVFKSMCGIWIAGVILYLFSFNGIVLAKFPEQIVSIVLIMIEIGAVMLSVSLVRKSSQPQARTVYTLLAASWMMLIISDSCLFHRDYILQIPKGTPNFSVCTIFFLSFLFLHVLVWIRIFTNFSEYKEKKLNSHCLPLVFIAGFIFMVFLFGINWKIEYSSIKGFENIIPTLLDTVGFVVAALCLIRARTIGIKCMAVGYILMIGIDIVIGNQYIQKNYTLYNYADITTLVSQILLNYGLYAQRAHLNREHKCLTSMKSMQAQVALWGIYLSMISVFVLLGLDIIFTTNNQKLIDNLPSIIIMISIVAIFVSMYLAQKILAPMYKLETDIEGYLASKAPFTPDESHITEFRKLHRFVQQSFTLQEKQWEDETEFADYIKRIIHDLRSPLSAINIVVQDLKDELQTDKRELLQSTVKHLNAVINMTLAKAKAGRGQEDKNTAILANIPDEDKFHTDVIVEE